MKSFGVKSLIANLPWRWIAIGAVAYLVFLIATLPASLITRRLTTQGIALSGVNGSIWNGRATAVQVRGLSFGATQWRLRPTQFLLGRLGVDLKATRDDGYINARIAAGMSGRIDVADLRASLPIQALSGALNGASALAANWQGSIQVQLDELSIDKGWPLQARGTIDAQQLVGPARQPAAIGSYRIEFDGKANKENAGELRGQVTSQDDAPLDVTGLLRLLPNRQYVIDAQVGTHADTPAAIVQGLQYLGAPNAQGKRSLSVSGSF